MQAVLILTHAPEFNINKPRLEIPFRIHIIKIREIRADNAADVIFSATQTWHMPEIKKM